MLMSLSKGTKRTAFSLFMSNVALALFTLTVWLVADPAIQFANLKIIDNDYPGRLASWRVTGNSANLRIEDNAVSVTPQEPERASVYKQYNVNKTSSSKQYIRIEGVLSGNRVNPVSDDAEQQQPNKPSIFYAWFENELKERIHVHILAELTNTEDPKSYTARMLIPAGATTISVGLLMRQFEFGFTLESLHIKQIERTTTYWLLLAGLGVFAIYLTFLASRWIQGSTKTTVAAMAAFTACILVVGIIAPGSVIEGIASGILKPLAIITDIGNDISLSHFQNVAHTFGFILLAYIAFQLGSVAGINPLDVLIKLGIFALLTEALQRHSVRRSPSMEDIVYDGIGIFLGFACWYCLSKRNRNELA